MTEINGTLYGGEAVPALSGTSSKFYGAVAAPAVSSATSDSFDVTDLLSSSTSLGASANSISAGGSVTFVATVGGTASTPTGTVTFLDNGNAIGSEPLVAGAATFATTSLPVGSNSITARYGGDCTYDSSTSNTIDQSYPALSQLSAHITRAVIPSANVAGQPLNARVPVSFTNTGSTLAGTYTVVLYADTSTGALSGKQVALETVTRHTSLKASRTLAMTLVAKKLPPTLPAGTYYLLAEVTDPLGNANIVNTSQTITVSAPFVALAASISAVIPATVAVNRFGSIPITVINNGNISAIGSLVITLLPSADGVSAAAGVTLTSLTRRVTLKPGKSGRYTLRFRVPAALAGGSYYPLADISLDGVSATAIGTSLFTVG